MALSHMQAFIHELPPPEFVEEVVLGVDWTKIGQKKAGEWRGENRSAMIQLQSGLDGLNVLSCSYVL